MATVLERERVHHDRAYTGEVGRIVRSYPLRRLHRDLLGRLWTWHVLRPGAAVISLGCGAGDLEMGIARRSRAVVAIDLSAVVIMQSRTESRAAGVSNAQFVVGDATRVPIRPACADVALSLALLHHVPDELIPDVLLQARQILRPGGAFCAVEPSADRLVGHIGRAFFSHVHRRHHSPDERELPPTGMQSLAESAGFRNVRVRFTDFAVGPLCWMFPGMPPRLFDVLLTLDSLLLRIPFLNRLASTFVLAGTA